MAAMIDAGIKLINKHMGCLPFVFGFQVLLGSKTVGTGKSLHRLKNQHIRA
jgi:hypothetical protein